MSTKLEKICKVINRRVEQDLVTPENFTILKVSQPDVFGLVTATILVDTHLNLTDEEVEERKGQRFIQRRVEFDPGELEEPEEIITIESVTISGEKELAANAVTKYTYTFAPENYTPKTIQWMCQYGTIDQSGNYTASHPGITDTITVTIDGKSSKITVVVAPEVIALRDFDVAMPNELEFNSNYQFTLTVEPADSTITSTTWSVDKGTIDQNGLFKGTVSGDITLTVKVNDRTETFKFKVKAAPPVLTSVKIIAFDQTPYGEMVLCSAEWEEPNYEPDSVVWEISNGEIDSTGRFVANQTTSPVIVTVTVDGLKATKSIIVDERIPELQSASISGAKEILHQESTTLDFTWVEPTYRVKTATWSVDKGTITQDGVYTATVANTTATVTLLLDGVVSTTHQITVGAERIFPTGVKVISPAESVEIGQGGSFKFTYEWIPKNANTNLPEVKFSGSSAVNETTGVLTIPNAATVLTIGLTGTDLPVTTASLSVVNAELDAIDFSTTDELLYNSPISFTSTVEPSYYKPNYVKFTSDKGTWSDDNVLTHDAAEIVKVTLEVDGKKITKDIKITSPAEGKFRRTELTSTTSYLKHRQSTVIELYLDQQEAYTIKDIKWTSLYGTIVVAENGRSITYTATTPNVKDVITVNVDGLKVTLDMSTGPERPQLEGVQLIVLSKVAGSPIETGIRYTPSNYEPLEVKYLMDGAVVDLSTVILEPERNYDFAVEVDGLRSTAVSVIPDFAIETLAISGPDNPLLNELAVYTTVVTPTGYKNYHAPEWSTDNGHVSSEGVYTPERLGAATITCVVDRKTATKNIIVSKPPLVAIDIKLEEGPYYPNTSYAVTFSPLPIDADLVDLTTFTDNGVVKDGVWTPGDVGNSMISASSKEIANSINVVVDAPIEETPEPAPEPEPETPAE